MSGGRYCYFPVSEKKVKLTQLCPDLCNPVNCIVVSRSLQPHGLNSPGQNTGVGNLSLLQGIFLTQELNQGFLHCRWILYQLSYQEADILIIRLTESHHLPTEGSFEEALFGQFHIPDQVLFTDWWNRKFTIECILINRTKEKGESWWNFTLSWQLLNADPFIRPLESFFICHFDNNCISMGVFYNLNL